MSHPEPLPTGQAAGRLCVQLTGTEDGAWGSGCGGKQWVSFHWVRTCSWLCLCRRGPQKVSRREASTPNMHVQHTHKPHASYFPTRIVKHKKLPSKNSHFLTPSNHISQKCLFTGSAYLSQNLSPVQSSVPVALLFCLILTRVGQFYTKCPATLLLQLTDDGHLSTSVCS